VTDELAGPRVVSLNVGAVREVIYRGKPRTTGIWKDPVAGGLLLHATGVEGDHQADPSVHGGPRKAVYAYAREDADWWAGTLGTPVGPGTFGENLTLEGVALNDAVLGEEWRVGGALVQVTQPRFPCWKLGFRMQDPHFPERFLAAKRPGTYVAVLEEGSVAAGDPVELVHRPEHGLTVGLIAHLNHADRPLALLLLEAVEAGLEPAELQDLIAQSGVA
jgi:MOSC domain-containing protein YiiM